MKLSPVIATLLISSLSGLPAMAQTQASPGSMVASAGVSATLSAAVASSSTSLIATPSPTPSNSGVFSYQAWKQVQTDAAKLSYERLQASLREVQGRSSKPVPPRPDQRIRQAQLNVEIAQELTVNDYFVLYLNQFKTKDAFLDAARKLSPEETAELLLAYQKHLSGSDQPEAPVGGLISGVAPAAPSTVKKR